MIDTHEHELRALLLAGIVTVWIVAASVGFAGGVAAQSNYQLEASDDAGGNASYLFADVENQLPEGDQSGDDTLRVEATDDALPQDFVGDLSLDEGGDLVFNATQNTSDVDLVVVGEDGSEATAADDNVAVTSISETTVEFQVSYDETDLFGQSEDPVAVEISNLSFDAGAEETATLTWHIPNEETGYDLVVENFDAELDATDENGGGGAQLTAGAENQTMVGYQGQLDAERAQNLVLSADEDEFPTEFQATVSIDPENVTFNGSLTEDEVVASSSNENAEITVEEVSPGEISVAVSNFDGTAEDATIVELEGVTYDVAADATWDSATWAVLGQNDSYTFQPEYLDASFERESYEITRGLDGRPDDGVTVEISAETKRTDGFHDQGKVMALEIPAQYRGELTFDEASQPQARMFVDGDVTTAVAADRVLLYGFPDDVDSGRTVTVSNIRFNTAGYDAAADDGSPTFVSGLDVDYHPVSDGRTTVANSTGSEALDVRVPDVSFENGAPTGLRPGTNGTTGDTAVEVNVTDTSGGQMANGTDVVIELDDVNGLTFDESQADDLQLGETVGFYAAADISVDGDQIVISIADFADSSQKGESVILEHEDGNGIRFNTTDSEVGDASLSVRTDASDAPVTQQAGTVAVVRPTDVEMSADSGPLTVGLPSDVTVEVTDGDGEPLAGVEVSAVGEFQDGPGTVESDSSGEATFTDLTPATDGDVSFEATEFAAATGPVTVEYADLTASPEHIQAGKTTEVVVTLTDADDEGIRGKTVNATSDRFDGSIANITDSSGQATVTLDASEDGSQDVTISVDELDRVDTVLDVREAHLAVEPREITPGEVTTVDLTLTDADGNGISGADVTVESGSVDGEPTNRTDSGGHATLDIEPTEPGSIVLEARDDAGEQLASNATEAVANISLDPGTISAHEESDVTVDVTGANDEPLDGILVNASGDPISDASRETEAGEVVFTFDPDQGGDVTVAADELGVETTLVVSGPSVSSDVDAINATADSAEVTFTVEDHSGDPVDATVEVVHGPAENATGDTDDGGEAVLALDPTDVGTITVQASTENGDTATTTVESVANVTVSSSEITAGENESVTITVKGVDDAGLEGVGVTASGEPLDENVDGTTDENGDAVLALDTVEPGTVDVTVDDLSLDSEVEVVADISADPPRIAPDQETDVQVTLTGADGGIEGAELEATGDPIDGPVARTTDSRGEAVFALEPDSEGNVTITADAHGVVAVVEVEDTSGGGGGGSGGGSGDGGDGDGGGGSGDGGGGGDEGGSSGGGGGGSGGAAAPEPTPDVQITSTAINETVIDVDDAVAVTVTVENGGDADGEFTAGLTSGGFTLASETVEVPEGETREVTLIKAFGEVGSFDLAINGDAEVGTLYVGVEPAAVTDSETVEIVDGAPDQPGVYVTCEDVSVRSITFVNGSAVGEVTVEDLSRVPLDATQPDDRVLRVFTIDVPDALEDEAATLEVALDATDLEAAGASAADLTVVHYDASADAWKELDTETVETGGEEVVVAAETPGFSMFAVTAQADEQTPTGTPSPTATDSDAGTPPPTDTVGATERPPEEQSGIPNPFVLGGLVTVLVVAATLAVVGKRLYEHRAE